MSEPFIGEVRMFAGTYAPRGWMFCNGQLLPIAQNSALFAILGTTYGGNGTNNFALPDLRGRSPVHAGQGNGLAPINLGQVGGQSSTTLSVNNLPPHNHAATLNGYNDSGSAGKVTNNFIAAPADGTAAFESTSNTTMNPNAVQVGIAGGGQPFDSYTPYQAVNFIIAIEGIFPSRN